MTEEEQQLARIAFRGNDYQTIARLLNTYPELKDRINEPFGPFDSPIITGVKSREMLDVLLDAGADINARSRWWAGGFGLLDSADPDLAHYAIERGAIVDIHAAARLNMIDRVRSLVTEDPSRVHARGGDGQTPLHFAGSIEVAEFLLDSGADIDALDIDHVSTPAQYMVRSRPEVARFLVSRGARTDILMLAALDDRKGAARILKDRPEAIRTRVREDFFPMIGKENGGTIYQWELGWYVSAHQVAKIFGHDRMFNFLMLSSPADVMLLAACCTGDVPLFQALREEYPEVSVPPEEHRNLPDAARNDDAAAVKLLLELGIPVSATGQHAGTALHWAAWNGNLSLIEEILRFDPPLEQRDRDFDNTPLMWAVYASKHGWRTEEVDYGPVVARLLEAGARPPERVSGTESVRRVLRTVVREGEP